MAQLAEAGLVNDVADFFTVSEASPKQHMPCVLVSQEWHLYLLGGADGIASMGRTVSPQLLRHD